MSRMAPNRRLSSLDAFFVYHERRQSPFNLGGVSIFDGEIPAGELLGTLSRRIGQVPRYRQRLMSEILNLGHPRWEDDPDFDLARHIIETRIEPPGTEDQLRRLAGVVMSGQLRRDRPLWDLTLVQGIEGGRSALIIRIHHCLVDGVAGVDLMSILLDLRAGRAERAAPPPFPENARQSGQRFAAVSYILDESDEMEMLLYIHAVFSSEKMAKACVVDELNDKLYPLPVDVVDMYQWIYPLRMTWENNSLSSRVDGLEETCAETMLQDSQAKRREAAEHNRTLKEEARKKKKMDAEVQRQLCERLGISAREFTDIIENEEMGTTSIIQLCKIEDDAERMAGVRALLDRMAGPATN
ncbi:MAG: hypothetical protein EBZ36_09970 [Acidobacteria bacterium]|nr:hypothetical protein [Acidobacteriota bacterium]